MKVTTRVIVFLLVLMTTASTADEKITYAPSKVVYDVSSPDSAFMSHIMDRASLLQNLYGNDPFESSIVIVIHEGAIPLFSNQKVTEHIELMNRARSLGLDEIIKFRICRASARMQGYNDSDFADFVRLVPMADAEIVRLQKTGYAYIR